MFKLGKSWQTFKKHVDLGVGVGGDMFLFKLIMDNGSVVTDSNLFFLTVFNEFLSQYFFICYFF
jgi:hypothetical protein